MAQPPLGGAMRFQLGVPLRSICKGNGKGEGKGERKKEKKKGKGSRAFSKEDMQDPASAAIWSKDTRARFRS